jgi:outer membrane protein assembly factor BamD (BamD/ComL family)
MKMKLLLACVLVWGSVTVEAGYTLRKGKVINTELAPTLPLQDHYQLGMTAIKSKNWREAAKQMNIVSYHAPSSSTMSDAFFYLGVAEVFLDEMDAANEAFTTYLKTSNPTYFKEAIEYKFYIADQLAQGKRRRIYGMKRLPKWASGHSLAIKIYDEVIASLPSHDLAARAFHSKGCLQLDLKEFNDSVDTFQMLIKRFPRHELTPDSYVAISKVYVKQSAYEFQNPDILEFAKINLTRFQRAFPREERIAEVETDLLKIKETYANGLYEIGQFYERIHKPSAAVLYYRKTIQQFPETQMAQQANVRLQKLTPGVPSQVQPVDKQEEMTCPT